VQLYLVHGMSDCGQKGIRKFEDGKVRDAATRLIFITNTNCRLGKVLHCDPTWRRNRNRGECMAYDRNKDFGNLTP
jgi:hypothetical protein